MDPHSAEKENMEVRELLGLDPVYKKEGVDYGSLDTLNTKMIQPGSSNVRRQRLKAMVGLCRRGYGEF